jgi:hypothetical protein
MSAHPRARRNHVVLVTGRQDDSTLIVLVSSVIHPTFAGHVWSQARPGNPRSCARQPAEGCRAREAGTDQSCNDRKDAMTEKTTGPEAAIKGVAEDVKGKGQGGDRDRHRPQRPHPRGSRPAGQGRGGARRGPQGSRGRGRAHGRRCRGEAAGSRAELSAMNEVPAGDRPGLRSFGLARPSPGLPGVIHVLICRSDLPQDSPRLPAENLRIRRVGVR